MLVRLLPSTHVNPTLIKSLQKMYDEYVSIQPSNSWYHKINPSTYNCCVTDPKSDVVFGYWFLKHALIIPGTEIVTTMPKKFHVIQEELADILFPSYVASIYMAYYCKRHPLRFFLRQVSFGMLFLDMEREALLEFDLAAEWRDQIKREE